MNGFAMITKDQLIDWAQANGWRLDRFGHLQKTNGSAQYRLKLSRIAARYETKTSHGWIRLRSGYYRDLVITADGRLAGMNL